MQNEKRFPYVKAFMALGGKVHYQPCFIQDEKIIYTEPLVGEQLIRFLELDLGEFKEHLDRVIDGRTVWSAEVFRERSYDSYAKELWSIMELLKPLHIFAHGYLISQMNQILSAVVHLEDSDLSRLEEVHLNDVVQCIKLLDEISALQKRFAEITSLCLDSETHDKYSLAERFVAVLLRYPQYNNFVFKTAAAIVPTAKGVLDGDRMQEIFELHPTNTREVLSEIQRTKEKGVSLVSCALLETFEEFLYFEFCEMLKNGLMAKRCKLCGRYFVSRDSRNRQYCSRVFAGNRTCKDLGAKMIYKEKTEGDPYLDQYEDIRQTYYSRKYRADGKRPGELSGKDMTDDEYAAWSEMAGRERQRYLDGEITGDALITAITKA